MNSGSTWTEQFQVSSKFIHSFDKTPNKRLG
jgi:hypothetical protein